MAGDRWSAAGERNARAGRAGPAGALVVDLLDSRDKPPFRCIPSELWGIDNNLDLANRDGEDFASAVDEAGVFRGFGEQLNHRSSPPR
jgi:hypothetical protein